MESRKIENGRLVCSNCGQYQHPRTTSFYDCVNDCATRGFAVGLVDCELYRKVMDAATASLPSHLRYANLLKSRPFVPDAEWYTQCPTCLRWYNTNDHDTCPWGRPGGSLPETSPAANGGSTPLASTNDGLGLHEVRGRFTGFENHGTIVLGWFKCENGTVLPIYFDHRPFRAFYESFTVDPTTRDVIYNVEEKTLRHEDGECEVRG